MAAVTASCRSGSISGTAVCACPSGAAPPVIGPSSGGGSSAPSSGPTSEPRPPVASTTSPFLPPGSPGALTVIHRGWSQVLPNASRVSVLTSSHEPRRYGIWDGTPLQRPSVHSARIRQRTHCLWQLQPSRMDLSNNETWKSRLLLGCWTTEGVVLADVRATSVTLYVSIRALGWSGACHLERALLFGKESFLLSSRSQQ